MQAVCILAALNKTEMKENKLNEAGYTETLSPRLASEMTIRERFAMAALQGLLAAYDKSMVYDLVQKTGKDIYYCRARLAVEQADNLINALNEKP